MNETKKEKDATASFNTDVIAQNNSSLAASNNSFNSLNLFDDKQLAAAEVFLKRLISTDKGGIKNVNEGLAILMRAQDLQLPFSSCIEHIHVIQGKTGVDIHIIRALLSKAGVTWKCIKDYTPQYQYTDGNTVYLDAQLPEYCIKCRNEIEAEEKTNDNTIGVYPLRWYQDLKGTVYNEFQISDKCVRALNKTQATKLAQEGKFPVIRIPAVPVDYVTEYEFTRYKMINGREVITTCTSRFSYSDAKQADLLDKENYRKYPKSMISIRAFTLGAREIADDVIMGVMETTELKIVTNSPLTSDDFIAVEEL